MSRNNNHRQRDNLPYINERITSPTVRLIGNDGKQSIVSTRDALMQAYSANLDLIQIAAGNPPVCRILDAGKYMFERKKMERENAKRQREMVVETKEVQLRPVTDEHDLLIKARKAKEFLEEGHKVKAVVRFRGREHAHKDVGRKVVGDFLAALGEYKIERPLTEDGKLMVLVIAPTKTRAEKMREKEMAPQR